MLGLYLHIPFCQAICSYCNFNRGLFDETLKARYVAALEQEIARAGDGSAADTIFFGGGTPSLLEPAEVRRIVGACRAAYDVAADAEVTLETNPETATHARLEGFRAAGINRISFGAQTFDNQQLRRLGRIHDAARIGEAVAAARAAGFDNISLDLMFWLPGQSRASWLDTVARAADLRPDHLSFYLLELYPNAPLKEAMERVRAAPPGASGREAWEQESDDEAADMYLDGLAALDELGYEQYEISNTARRGRASRHNLKYWTGGTWRGFGCGAHSTADESRWQNVAGTSEYVERLARGDDVRIQMQRRSTQNRIEEALFTGLRLTAGIDRTRFAERYGVDPWTEYGDRLRDAVDAGFVWRREARFGLTRQGMLVANEILAAFV
jgi:oxygen-independent coproporphyrinogen-3 oxidase